MDTNRFTQKSLEALQAAQQLAQSYGNAQVEQVHLLYALLSQENVSVKCEEVWCWLRQQLKNVPLLRHTTLLIHDSLLPQKKRLPKQPLFYVRIGLSSAR